MLDAAGHNGGSPAACFSCVGNESHPSKLDRDDWRDAAPDFATKHAVLSLTKDQTAAEIAMGCSDPKKGLAVLTFTGVNGPSTLTIE